jgi:hypothetical protein
VPVTLSGGLSPLSGLLGYIGDSILSSHLITSAHREIITVSATSHHELLYGFKGADQHLGLVTSLTIRVSPLSILELLMAPYYPTRWSSLRARFTISFAFCHLL